LQAPNFYLAATLMIVAIHKFYCRFLFASLSAAKPAGKAKKCRNSRCTL